MISPRAREWCFVPEVADEILEKSSCIVDPGFLRGKRHGGQLRVIPQRVAQRSEHLLLHGDPDTYRYIAASLQRYPGGRGVADRMRVIGFTSVGQVPLLGGLMAITYGTR